ncbi:MAG: hypothetical protein K0R76_752 [Alphaproteobacteria bacterium]|nr:hypothetical protein [Alphaproteobacteria bacterium]
MLNFNIKKSLLMTAALLLPSSLTAYAAEYSNNDLEQKELDTALVRSVRPYEDNATVAAEKRRAEIAAARRRQEDARQARRVAAVGASGVVAPISRVEDAYNARVGAAQKLLVAEPAGANVNNASVFGRDQASDDATVAAEKRRAEIAAAMQRKKEALARQALAGAPTVKARGVVAPLRDPVVHNEVEEGS